MHRFDEHTLVTDFIKNLLYNVWLPTYDTVVDGDYIHKNFLYVYKDKVIKCIESGYILPDNISDDVAITQIIGNYKFGGKYRKCSDNFIANTSRYTTEIHERLGKFVRCYSELTGVNLKPYYNLVSNHFIQNTMVIQGVQNQLLLTDEFTSDVRCYIVPIRFNRKYTLALECSTSVYISPVFLSKERKVTKTDAVSKEKQTITDLFNQKSNQIKQFSNFSFQSPQIVEIECKGELADEFYRYQNNLYLMIQVPQYNKSSVVLIEGDYTNRNGDNVVEIFKLNRLSTKKMDELFITKPSLLLLSAGYTIPFSNRLVEYLFDNVIENTIEFDETIEKAQEAATYLAEHTYVKGVWDNITRAQMYRQAMNNLNRIDRYDLSGYVDRSVEKLLLNSQMGDGEF